MLGTGKALAPKQVGANNPPKRNFITSKKCSATNTANYCRAPHPWVPQVSGNEIQAYETSKYMGIMIYAVNAVGEKVRVDCLQIGRAHV